MSGRVEISMGDLPPRTEMHIGISPEMMTLGLEVGKLDAPHLQRVYRCLDCGGTTESLDQMKAHQASHWLHHTAWQRLWRWLVCCLLYARGDDGPAARA